MASIKVKGSRRLAPVCLAAGALACGDTLVDSSYSGTPLFTLQGVVAGPSEVISDPETLVTTAMFWSPQGVMARGYDELVEQRGTASAAPIPRPYVMNLFDVPGSQHLYTAPSGARYAIGRVVAYVDTNRNGWRAPSEPIARASQGYAVLYAPQALRAEDSPTGRPLAAGWQSFLLRSVPRRCSGRSSRASGGRGLRCAHRSPLQLGCGLRRGCLPRRAPHSSAAADVRDPRATSQRVPPARVGAHPRRPRPGRLGSGLRILSRLHARLSLPVRRAASGLLSDRGGPCESQRDLPAALLRLWASCSVARGRRSRRRAAEAACLGLKAGDEQLLPSAIYRSRCMALRAILRSLGLLLHSVEPIGAAHSGAVTGE